MKSTVEEDAERVREVMAALAGPLVLWRFELSCDAEGGSLHYTKAGALAAAIHDLRTQYNKHKHSDRVDVDVHIEELTSTDYTCVLGMYNYAIEPIEVQP